VQQYTLVVQNASLRQDLGVATASTQFFRNVGSTVGIAIFGSVMTGGLAAAIASHLPAGVADDVPAGAADPGAVLDPETLAAVPPQVADAVREGLADQLHSVFLLVLPIVVLIFLATLAIRVIPLRDTLQSREDAGRELLDTLNQSAYSADEVVTPYRLHDRTRERVLGTLMQLLSSQAAREDRPLLRRAVSELGDGDLEWGRKLLDRTATLLTSEDEVAARAEKYAAIVADRAKSGVLDMDLMRDLAEAAKSLRTGDGADRPEAAEPTVAARYEAVDVTRLRAAGNELTAVLLVDLASQGPESGAEPAS
jgi:hypothetical protein